MAAPSKSACRSPSRKRYRRPSPRSLSSRHRAGAASMCCMWGYITDEMRTAAAQLGVRSLLHKEYTLERLGGIVRRILNPPAGG